MEVSTAICYNCGKSGHPAKFWYVKGVNAKGKKGDSKGWNDSKGWSDSQKIKVWNTSRKSREQPRPAGMNNLERLEAVRCPRDGNVDKGENFERR